MHEYKRLGWTTFYVQIYKRAMIKKVISDEKKFNLHVPYGLSSYWHALRNKRRIRLLRQINAVSAIVRVALLHYKSSRISKLTGIQKAEGFCNVWEKYLLPLINKHMQSDCRLLFQHDNALIHTAKIALSWLEYNNVEVMNFLSRSDDLSHIENLRGAMVWKCREYR